VFASGVPPYQALDEDGCRFQGDVMEGQLADHLRGRSAKSTNLLIESHFIQRHELGFRD